MAVLNKLLDLLEQVKSENPELANRVTMASEVLNLNGLVEEEPEPEEEFDDTYVPISEEHTERMNSLTTKLNRAIHDYGHYMRDHEVVKLDHLERIENLRNNQERLVQLLKSKHRLNEHYQYDLVSDGPNLVFVKKEV